MKLERIYNLKQISNKMPRFIVNVSALSTTLICLFNLSCSTYRSSFSKGLQSPTGTTVSAHNQNEDTEFIESDEHDEYKTQIVSSDDRHLNSTESESVVLPQYRFSPVNRSQPRFEWPVDDARLTRGFLPKKRRPHLGIDLAASKNSPIYAAHSGTVIYAGKDFRGYGKMLLLDSGTGWATLYAHFNNIYVREGQKINKGDILGGMGRTGRATGVHLHFEIRKEREPLDPLSYLPHGNVVANQIKY